MPTLHACMHACMHGALQQIAHAILECDRHVAAPVDVLDRRRQPLLGAVGRVLHLIAEPILRACVPAASVSTPHNKRRASGEGKAEVTRSARPHSPPLVWMRRRLASPALPGTGDGGSRSARWVRRRILWGETPCSTVPR
eukprot:COSAG01_NODE_6614_length_3581_cov_1.071018_1_plen_139_part_10